MKAHIKELPEGFDASAMSLWLEPITGMHDNANTVHINNKNKLTWNSFPCEGWFSQDIPYQTGDEIHWGDSEVKHKVISVKVVRLGEIRMQEDFKKLGLTPISDIGLHECILNYKSYLRKCHGIEDFDFSLHVFKYELERVK